MAHSFWLSQKLKDWVARASVPARIVSGQRLPPHQMGLRLRKHTHLQILTPAVSSSGRRWLERGYFSTTLKNCFDLTRHLAERTFTSHWSEKGELKRVGEEGRSR